MLHLGFAKSDITPRVGVELCGFGPYRLRQSTSVRDPLYARAMALQLGPKRLLILSCDMIGSTAALTGQVRRLLYRQCAIPAEAVMISCSHTHSGPATGPYIGWGEPDAVYVATLASRIAAAGVAALAALTPATLAHAEVPCEGLALNREYDKDAPPLAEVLREDWRPAKPELTDTTCRVLTGRAADDGRLLGFVSYFSCHPVVCCAANTQIHGDYCGVATNLLEREHPGSVGLFLQGTQGDINSCVVHKGAQESLHALDILASRYARAVRPGLTSAQPLTIDRLASHSRRQPFSRAEWDDNELRRQELAYQTLLEAPGASDAIPATGPRETHLTLVKLNAVRQLLARAAAGEPAADPSELQGLCIGPLRLLGSGFEIFHGIKRELLAELNDPMTLVCGICNDAMGYAVDKTTAAKGGYAAGLVPYICAQPPYTAIHDELLAALRTTYQALG